MSLPVLAFASPWVLTALAALPVIWILLRFLPPKPRLQVFPPFRLLARLANEEKTPAHSPWWLVALRMTLIALIILACAGPRWNPIDPAPGEGQLALIIENGWTSAADWPTRRSLAEAILKNAMHKDRPVTVLATAEPNAAPASYQTAKDALSYLKTLRPRAWPSNWKRVTSRFSGMATSPPEGVVLIASSQQQEGRKRFLDQAVKIIDPAQLLIYASGNHLTTALSKVTGTSDGLSVRIIRTDNKENHWGTVTAFDAQSRQIGAVSYRFPPNQRSTNTIIDLPSELRNQVTQIKLGNVSHAGATRLLDGRHKRYKVGIVSGESLELDQPLLAANYYLAKAIKPFFNIVDSQGANLSTKLESLAEHNVSAIIAADIGRFVGESIETVEKYVSEGGTLIRFAGPRLAAGGDEMLPVILRKGERLLGGGLTWTQQLKIDRFSPNGPLADLTIPDEIQIVRQILAEPTLDLAENTWASLSDGSPLITAERRHKGWIILIHVSADTRWSNLPLSGTFVEILQRIITYTSQPVEQQNKASASIVTPYKTLDGFGALGEPLSFAKAFSPKKLDLEGLAARSAQHPPGIYTSNNGRVAVNLLGPSDQIAPLSLEHMSTYGTMRELKNANIVELTGPLFFGAFLLFFLDLLCALWLAGALTKVKQHLHIAGLLLVVIELANSDVLVAEENSVDFSATLEVRLAHVLTGNAAIDDTAKRGLDGLSRILTARTAIETGEPIGVDVSSDELGFFPILYWPIFEDQAIPSSESISKIDTYMKNGGSILFDTRDQIQNFGPDSLTPQTNFLRRLLLSLDIPPLQPVPLDHVLTKTFYLLSDFPGRWSGSPLWVEAIPQRPENEHRPARGGDGISPILITGNDLAGAWAIDSGGHFISTTIPDDPRQREHAFRAGVNIMMYALTGNYKADQVHIPALLERLNQ